MAFDVARVRGLFPALGNGWVHLDAPCLMQVPESVAAAVSTALRAPVSGPGGLFPSSQRADGVSDAARRAVADLVGGRPEGVVLGPSAAVLLRRLAQAVSRRWVIGDEVVLSRLDAPENVDCWQEAAEHTGASVRRAEVDIETCELPEWQYRDLVGQRTKLVATTAASAVVGTRPDLRRISEVCREQSALLVLDASAAAPFVPLDLDSTGADVLALSASAWGGPPVGALVFRDPALLDRLPSRSLHAQARGPARMELGPHSYPMLFGLVSSVDYLAQLDDAAQGSRRERLQTSLASLKSYQAGLLATLVGGLRKLPGVQVLGDAMRRVPAVAFTVDGVQAPAVVEFLAGRGVCVYADPGRTGLLATLGVAEVGGVVQAGLAHYTNSRDVERLLRAVAELPGAALNGSPPAGVQPAMLPAAQRSAAG